jgi:hypothetical protein
VSVLVVCAVAAELAALRTRADVDVVAVGVGPVEAALGTARALAARPYAPSSTRASPAGSGRAPRSATVSSCAHEHYVELGLEDGTDFPLPGGVALIRRAERTRRSWQRARRHASRRRSEAGLPPPS